MHGMSEKTWESSIKMSSLEPLYSGSNAFEKCMIFEGQHCIYYYLPVVDEFFRSRSKGLDTGIPTLSEDTPITDTPGNADKPAENNKAEIGTATPFTTRILPYKPMRIV